MTLPARDKPGLQKVLPMITDLKQWFLSAYSLHPQNSIEKAIKNIYT